ncbi:MAG: transposase, partial [Mycobacterium sp.]
MSTDEALTPFGGLVPWCAFLRRTGMVEALAGSCPVVRTSPNALPVFDVLVSFLLTAVCDGRRFAHVHRLRADPAVSELFGLRRGVAGDDSIRRLFGSIDAGAAAGWIDAAMAPLWTALPEPLILDWDSTVQTRYGRQEGAAIGYNPHKRGRASHHPLLAVAAGTRLCLHYRFRPGNTVTATQWREAVDDCLAAARSAGRRPWLHRGDMGLGVEPVLAWHEEEAGRPDYLFKPRLTAHVRRSIAALSDSDWQGSPQAGALQVAELPALRLQGWSRGRRVVVGRRWRGTDPAGPG